MYAEPRYHASRPRSVSLGAAFLINGAIIGGLFLLIAPRIGVKPPVTVLEGRNIPNVPVPPPPPEPKPQPKTEATPQQPDPFAPPPRVPTASENPIETTTILPPEPVPPIPAEKTGPLVIAEPPAQPLPPPPLIGAVQDPRFARDFQPDYPASELRSQRDGQVSVRVLIGTDGRVKAVEQVSATSPAFFDATRRQALARWRFKPATRGGVPQESWKVMNVRFEIANL